jgi:exoenzyme U
MTGSTQVGQGQPETLVRSVSDQELSIRRYENGVVEIHLKRPQIERQVPTGGNTRGLAFSSHEPGETYTFNSMGGALLALDDQMFEAAMLELKNDQACEAVIAFRQQAQHALDDLKQSVIDAFSTSGDRLELSREMHQAMHYLDQLGDTPGKTAWLAIKLNHGSSPDYRELLQAVKRLQAETAGPKSAVLTEAIKQMDIRDI